MPGCVVKCSIIYNDAEGKRLASAYEYEGVAMLGTNLGIYNHDDIAQLKFTCDDLGIDIINIPLLGVFKIGAFYIPLSAFIIIAFTNAFNITDGLDGLASGLLVICLFAFCFISFQIFDTPSTVFIAIWIGTLIAFLYFNTYPARIFLGDTGALAFGATMAVIGLMLGKIIALTVIGGIFIIEVGSSLLQMLSKLIRKKKWPVRKRRRNRDSKIFYEIE